MAEFSALVYGPESLGVIADFKQAVLGIVALAAIRTDEITAPAAAAAIVVLGYPKSCTATARNHKHARSVVDVCGWRFSGRAHWLEPAGFIGDPASDHGHEHLGFTDL
jgi:hypothetical protein